MDNANASLARMMLTEYRLEHCLSFRWVAVKYHGTYFLHSPKGHRICELLKLCGGRGHVGQLVAQGELVESFPNANLEHILCIQSKPREVFDGKDDTGQSNQDPENL